MATGCSTIEDFVCPICQCIFEDPVTLSCAKEHNVCRQCSDPLMKDDQPKCPICRTVLKTNRVRSNKSMDKMIKLTSLPCFACSQLIPLHQMNQHQRLCDKVDMKISYFKPVKETTQRIPVDLPNRATFQCPYCDLRNLDNIALLKHCNENHAHSHQPVVCPVCASMPWGDKRQTSANFIQHLNLRHKFEYETFVDYNQDDDAMLRAAIQASLQNS